MTSDQTRISLRALAQRLGCSHSALHKAVHDRRLTAGVRLDDRGRIHVVDAAAAAAEWAVVHTPRIDQLERRRSVAVRRDDLIPVDIFEDLSKQDLLECWIAFDTLAHALVAESLASSDPTAAALTLMERVASRVRARDLGDEVNTDVERLLDQLATEILDATPTPAGEP